MTIRYIGAHFPGEEENYIRLNSSTSLSDVDIVIFSPDFEDISYNYDPSYRDEDLLDRASSIRLRDLSHHWNQEIQKFLNAGKTLFVMLRERTNVNVYSGRGSRDAVPFSNYSFLPGFSVTYHSASGSTIVPISPLVAGMYNDFKDLFKFEAYLGNNDGLQVLFSTRNKDRILGAILRVDRGHIVYLPNIDFDIEKHTRVDKKTKEEFWTQEALNRSHAFQGYLLEVDKVIRAGDERTPAPRWIQNKEFDLNESTMLKKQIKRLEHQIEQKNKSITALQTNLAKHEGLKDLLFENGKALELAVTRALQLLGYTAENFNDGDLELDQIIESPEGQRFIGECEGKDNKDIDVSKFRQLLDGLNADFEKDTVNEKAFGLLFGNPQRLTEPCSRSLDFTAKCKSGAKREKIGLIRTSDLYNVCRHIIETDDDSFKKKCRAAILNGLGGIIQFPTA